MSETQAGLFGREHFNAGAGRERSDRKLEGLRAKAEKSGSTYLLAARAAIHALALGDAPFTSETVVKAIGYVVGMDHRVIGCALREARVEGVIRATGRWVTAEARSRNGGSCREWAGVKR